MSTVRDLIKGSLRLLGAIASGETPTSDELADALVSLNDIVDSWSNESLIIPNKVRETFTLTSSQSAYTMGTGGDFNTDRPMMIESAGVIDTNSNEYPIDIINTDQYAAITQKTTTSTLPLRLYVEYTYALATLNYWPVPSSSSTAVLYSWKPLAEFAAVSDTVTLPPGYKRALRYHLAVDLAPEYGKIASQELLSSALESKENIKRMNVKPIYMACDPMLVNRRRLFNIYTGQ